MEFYIVAGIKIAAHSLVVSNKIVLKSAYASG
jgi:hypothetical protein